MVLLSELPIRILLHLLARDDFPRRRAEALVLVSPERGTQEKLFPLVRLSSLEAERAPVKDPVYVVTYCSTDSWDQQGNADG